MAFSRTLESEDELISVIILALEKVFNTKFGSRALLDSLVSSRILV
jgi:hypothetical protein